MNHSTSQQVEWRPWKPKYGGGEPRFERKEGEKGTELLIAGSGKAEDIGAWIGTMPAKGGAYYRVAAKYVCSGLACEETAVVMQAIWNNTVQKKPFRDYIHHRRRLEGGQGELHRIVQAPPEAESVELYLYLRQPASGRVVWSGIEVVELDPHADASLISRKARIATTMVRSDPYPTTVERNLAKKLALLDQMKDDRPDLICMTECMLDGNCYPSYEERAGKALAMDSAPIRALADKARELRSYLTFSFFENENGTLYNTAVLFGRDGELVGKYRKTHLTTGEYDMGIVPGRELPVFQLDFGKVGLLICWDAWFTESARILAMQGADIICVPLNGDGVPHHAEHVWPTRAFDNGVYMVYSAVYKGSPSSIIAPNGQFLASVAGDSVHQTVEIDLEERNTLCPHLSVGYAIGEGKVLYFAERRPDLYPKYFGLEN